MALRSSERSFSYPEILSTTTVHGPGQEEKNRVVTCAIEATWVKYEIYAASTTPHLAQAVLGLDNDTLAAATYANLQTCSSRYLEYALEAKSSVRAGSRIHMDPSWASSLNQARPNSSVTTLENLFQNLAAQENFNRNSLDGFSSTLVASVFADGISRVGIDKHTLIIDPKCNGDDCDQRMMVPENITDSWMRVQFPIYRYGYGYSFHGIAIRRAMIPLMAHIALATMHCTWLLYSGTTYPSWNNIGEVIALTMGPWPCLCFEAPLLASRTRRPELDELPSAQNRQEFNSLR
ncbi:uncharacterized protein BDZ99DRAFT_575592 [Mytilinidion resinicola]|uniref:Uncharacterized protein n=1 Tax=Mytilinidion resinicola TaxID=574789 RepID=A0A6A6Y527_9PEZI|nr:uncharacterized protein BDZ99DRAFT_575592 [Mytilinidion resinicola]KAF2803916.1 hypothetical protein BDZ99DRAFT_575592 [Mytilinidion resinicola]